MRLDGNAEATSHSDINYYWFDRTRVHVPLVTHPEVTFHCGDRSLHMGAGEFWIFDTWRPHRVVNPRLTRRIHLVADTVGSAQFWSLADAGDRVFAADRKPPIADHEIAFVPGVTPELECETWNSPVVMSPAQLEAIIAHICASFRRRCVRAAYRDIERTLCGVRARMARIVGQARRCARRLARIRRRARALRRRTRRGRRRPRIENGSDLRTVLRELLLRPVVNAAAAGNLRRNRLPRMRIVRHRRHARGLALRSADFHRVPAALGQLAAVRDAVAITGLVDDRR